MISNRHGIEEILDNAKADKIVALDKDGNEAKVLFENKDAVSNNNIFPIVVQDYEWSRNEQVERANKFRDRIEYIYYPENDKENPMLSVWRLDDTDRIKATVDLPFGEKILESGCSSGTMTLEISRLKNVKEVVGVDIREDAISRAGTLTKDLVKKSKLKKEDTDKVTFISSAIEDLDHKNESFDTVCAFEVLEHITPNDFDTAVSKLAKLMKGKGNFLMSVPNRYPDNFFVKEGRTRWNAPDHKNFFSKTSLEFLLGKYFNSVKFFPVGGESVGKGVYLICECKNKK